MSLFTQPLKKILRNALFLLALCVAGFQAKAQTVVFTQDFESSTTLATYIGTGTNQFDNISAGGSTTAPSINTLVLNERLRLTRSGSAGTNRFPYAVKTTNFSPAIDFGRIRMRFYGNGGGNITEMARVYVGNNLNDNNTDEAAYAVFGFDRRTLGYRIRNSVGGASSGADILDGSEEVFMYFNNTGFTVTYLSPAGVNETLANDRIDIFSGTTRLFNDQNVQNAGQTVTDFKIRLMTTNNLSADFDDIVIERGHLLTTVAAYGPICITPGSASSAFNVAFTSPMISAYPAGNTFTAQLSDASGSFASPTSIGTLSSTSPSGNVSCTIPAGFTAGAGYRIRIVSNNFPAAAANDNGSNITIQYCGTLSTTAQGYGPICITAALASTSFNVPYSSSSITWAAGNTFTAQLSNSAGSFAAPTTIGTLSSTATSGNISCSVPAGTASGAGYRIRVITTNYTSGNNGTNISVGICGTLSTTTQGYTQQCVTPTVGSAITIPYSCTSDVMLGGGNTFTVQLSNASGSFAAPTTIGTLASTALSGNISCTIPANTPSGTGYRIRVICPSYTSADNGVNIDIQLSGGTVAVTPTYQQQVDVSGTGATLTATITGNSATINWGYRTTSGGTITMIPGATGSTYTINGAHFPSKGSYYLVAVIGCNTAVSNEVKVYVNCTTGTNLVTNGDFSAGNTGFTSQYNFVTANGDQTDGNPCGNTMNPEGTYAVGINPRGYHCGFCNLEPGKPAPFAGNMLIGNAATNGSLNLWAQTIAVTANTDYVVSFDAISLAGTPQSLTFGLNVDCKQVGDVITGQPADCTPIKFIYQFNSGASTSIVLAIRNISVLASGNDIAVDNIQMIACSSGTPFPELETALVWRGFTNNWQFADNWGSCVLPTCNIDVRIPVVGAGFFYPVLAAGTTGTVKDITIDAGATVTINATSTLNICGDVTYNGSFVADNTSTTVLISTKSPQYIKTDILGAKKFGNFKIQKNALAQIVEMQGDIEVGNLFHLSQGTLQMNARTAKANAAVTFSGSSSLNAGTGTFEFNGSGNQVLTINNAAQFYNVFINNSSASSQISYVNAPLIVTNRLNLTRGIVTTAGALETRVTNGAYDGMTNYSANSYIAARLRKDINYTTGVVDFPVGTIAKGYQLARLNFTAATAIPQFLAYFNAWGAIPNSTNAGVLTTNPNECGSPMYSGPFLDNGFWIIDAASNGGTGTYNTELYPTNATNAAAAKTVVKRPTASGGVNGWTITGTCVSSPPAGAVARTGMNSFSQFAIAQGAQPFPVELLALEATPENQAIRVQWITGVEVNNAGFELQRSTEQNDFEDLTWKDGAGNSSSPVVYSHLDEKVVPLVTYYYRLKQKDFDGKTSLSPVVAAQISADAVYVAQIYPNPTQGDLSITIGSQKEAVFNISCVNMLGQTVKTRSFNATEGVQTFTMDTADLAAGTYTLKVEGNGNKTAFKFVKLQ